MRIMHCIESNSLQHLPNMDVRPRPSRLARMHVRCPLRRRSWIRSIALMTSDNADKHKNNNARAQLMQMKSLLCAFFALSAAATAARLHVKESKAIIEQPAVAGSSLPVRFSKTDSLYA